MERDNQTEQIMTSTKSLIGMIGKSNLLSLAAAAEAEKADAIYEESLLMAERIRLLKKQAGEMPIDVDGILNHLDKLVRVLSDYAGKNARKAQSELTSAVEVSGFVRGLFEDVSRINELVYQMNEEMKILREN